MSQTISNPSQTSAIPTATCTTGVPGHNGYLPLDACNAQWPYSPSFSAAVAYAFIFGLLMVAHITLAIIHRRGFCWVVCMGAAWEFAAFVTRALGAHHQDKGYYAISSLLLFILAPLWINAFIYMTGGRLIYMLHPEQKIWGVKAVNMGKWFVGLDILSFLVQGVGGVMLGPGESANAQKLGKNIYMTGVGIQELFILLFTTVIVRFHLDTLQAERQGLLSDVVGKSNKRWKYLIYTLYTVLALITMRIIYRLVEFSAGADPKTSTIPFHEGYALGLDAFPMSLALLLLAVFHPGLVLKGPLSHFPTRKEKKAEKKAAKAEKKAEKEEMKRLKAAKKAGAAAVVDTSYSPYAPIASRTASEEHLTHNNDVEVGFLAPGHSGVARY